MTRVGIFDSGVGGLSVWREVAALLPEAETLYVADQAHIPYGPRPMEEIRGFARGIARFLIEEGCATIVVACNAASAAALATLRSEFPATAFVGMEPAVKPAVTVTRRGVVGVLATPATFQGELFATTVERFAADVQVVRQICPGLVERIEAGDVDGPPTRAMLAEFLRASLESGADAIVLACTHYPFVRDAIQSLAGPDVRVIDPAPAVARQVARVTLIAADAKDSRPAANFYTTGEPAEFERVASMLLGRKVHATRLTWRALTLIGR